MKNFDAFLSYNIRDAEAAEAIARSLERRGLRVFYDRWYLQLGQPWPEALEEAMESCRAAVILLGPTGLGPWQQRERGLALRRQAGERQFPVIPVILPGADPPLGLLALQTWVDLRSGIADASLGILVKGIQGKPSGWSDKDEGITLTNTCPFRGLEYFREEDAPFFFGREECVARMVRAVEEQPITAIVGASGCGKSSVVRAGLVARLRRSELVWDIVTMTPLDRPLHRLAAALSPLIDPAPDEESRIRRTEKISRGFTEGCVSLIDIVKSIMARQSGTNRLLLIVDQWEELYTLHQDEQDKGRFVEEILRSTEQSPLSVVLTLRADYYGHAVSLRPLSDRLQDAVINIGPMTRTELKRAMEEPVRGRLIFEPGLVDRILDDVSLESGALPLMEFLLARLWERRQGAYLTHKGYEAIGGAKKAIAERAEEVFDSLEASVQRELPSLLRALVTFDPHAQGAATARGVSFEKFAITPQRKILAEAFVNARLMVADRGEEARAIIRVAHEALLESWPRLQVWLADDREFLRARERIEYAFSRWREEGMTADFLLSAGKPLADAEDLLVRRKYDLDGSLIEFVEASVQAHRSRLEMELVVERRRREEADRLRAEADAERTSAARARSFFLVSQAQQETLAGNTSKAIILALEALNELRPIESYDPIDAERCLDGAVKLYLGLSILAFSFGRPKPKNGTDRRVVLSPDGQLVCMFGTDALRMLEAQSGGEVAILSGHTREVTGAYFSQDGRMLVSASMDRTARVWDVQRSAAITTLAGHRDVVLSARFDWTGERVITASGDSSARIWDLQTGSITIIQSYEAANWYFSPLEWAASSRTAGHFGAVVDAMFSPNGEILVTASRDCTVRIWSATGRQIRVLVKHTKPLTSVAFSPDGYRFVTCSEDGLANIWDIDGSTTPLRGHREAICFAAFSCDNKTVFTASRDGTARLWDAHTGETLSVMAPNGEDVRRILLSLATLKSPLPFGAHVLDDVFSFGGWPLRVDNEEEIRHLFRPLPRGHDLIILAQEVLRSGQKS